MALIIGKSFVRDLEKSGSLGIYTPLEGGFEGRYQRRVRAAGYRTLNLTARGLGDLSAYLMGIHGVRPAHLGKKNIAQEAAVGTINYIPGIASYQLANLPPQVKGLVLWIIEGHILARDEVEYLVSLAKQEPKIKIVLELGGERYFRWQPLAQAIAAA